MKLAALLIPLLAGTASAQFAPTLAQQPERVKHERPQRVEFLHCQSLSLSQVIDFRVTGGCWQLDLSTPVGTRGWICGAHTQPGAPECSLVVETTSGTIEWTVACEGWAYVYVDPLDPIEYLVFCM